jgi:hypothetical protein
MASLPLKLRDGNIIVSRVQAVFKSPFALLISVITLSRHVVTCFESGRAYSWKYEGERELDIPLEITTDGRT